MTYVSKKEKVFDLPEQDEASVTSLVNSEMRLKNFPSVSDRRAWSSEESQRYNHLYSLVSGSESNISKSSSFKYIPFDVLLAILMAEKDAYIQELLERQEDKSSRSGKADVLYKAEGYEDSDDDREALIRKDAEVVSLKNKIASLESQLEDYRETLTKAMHKLENMDAILNENNLLRQKIKYSEETIKCLEEKKEALEKELSYLKSKLPEDFLKEKSLLKLSMDSGDCEEIFQLSSERDILLQQVEKLQKELERAKLNTAETEVFRKMSETTASSLEELSRENEGYKKKLESMKYLEKQIEDLKKQAYTLTDKYKKESKKANEQLKQIQSNAKELQLLRQEKNKLEERVNELLRYESQYLSLQTKLHKVEAIIDENEFLNKKLIQLDRLEVENEQLRKKIEQLKIEGSQAIEDKEKIISLQCAVVDQEEEIRKMLRQIEELSQGYVDKNEIYQMKNELEEKNGKLKKYEKQLAEIPILESEVDELKNKLQKCIDDFKSDKNLLQRLQEELEACRKRCHELEELAPLCSQTQNAICKNVNRSLHFIDKGENTEEVSKRNSESQSSMNEIKDESTEANFNAMELKEIEEQNKNLRIEVEFLKQKLSEIDLDYFILQTEELKSILYEKENTIAKLQCEIQNYQEQLRIARNERESMSIVEDELKVLKQTVTELEKQLIVQTTMSLEAKNLKHCLEKEKRARNFATHFIKDLEEKLKEEKLKKMRQEDLLKLSKEEANTAKQQLYYYFTEELNELKAHIKSLEDLSSNLKTENEILREIKEWFDTKEKPAMEGRIKKMKAQIQVLESLSKPKLEEECESLKEKIKSLLAETDSLVEGIAALKSTLELEKKEKENLMIEFENFKTEFSACIAAGNEKLNNEIAAKDVVILNIQKKLEEANHSIENLINEAQILKDENTTVSSKYSELKLQYEDAESDFRLRVEELLLKIDLLEESRLLDIKKIETLEDSRVKNVERIKSLEECREKDLENIKSLEDSRKESLEKIKILEENLTKNIEKINDCQNKVDTENKVLIKQTDLGNDLSEKISELEELVKTKEEELQKTTEKYLDVKTELYKVNSELEDIKSKLLETNAYFSIMNYEESLKQKDVLEEASYKLESDLEELNKKLEECENIENEMNVMKNKRLSLLEKLTSFEREIEVLEFKVGDLESLKSEIEKLKAEKEMYKLKEEMSSFAELLQEFEMQKVKIGELEIENETLKIELQKSENLLEVCTKLQKTIPEGQTGCGNEFFTPPALPSPRSPGANEYTNDLMSVDIHKKEIAELENYYKAKISELKESNAEKIKKLIMQNENESKCRSKAFHDSINGIKSSYETNIRKLVEKHKSSILRLQDLHEDEVQELNKNYETQMEAMQTQNENLINDLRTESAEKYKELVEQHNVELKAWQEKYDELLKVKEDILASKKKYQKSHKGVENVQRGTDRLSLDCQLSAMELEEKHSKELKKCKKNNLKRIEVMKNKYEALLEAERKKYEEQLEEVLLKLKNGRSAFSNRAEESNFPQKKLTSSPSLEFLEILQKILNEGLESLTFEELVLVHSKTCFVPALVEVEGGAGEDVVAADGCPHRTLMMAEREELLKKIFALEREIVIKQLETHEAIVNMENAEKCQIEELKNALFAAQEKNLELKKAMTNQSKIQTDLQIEKYMLDKQASLHETSALEKVKELERERAEKKILEEELEKEKANVKHLAATLELEKEWFRNRRKRDCEYVESIRQRLEEALSHEQVMESQLDYETRFRAKMEAELQALQKTFNLIVDSPPHQIISESKVVKDIKNFDQCEITKEERRVKNKSKFKK